MADEEKPRAIQSNLVTDVLHKTGQLEQEDFHTCVKKMLRKAEEVKGEVFHAIYKEYSFAGFQDLSSSTYELNWKVSSLLTEIETTSNKIKGTIEGELDAAANEYTDLTRQLKETEAIAIVLTKLSKIHAALDAFPGVMSNGEYCKAAGLIDVVNEHLVDLPKAGQESKIRVALREELRRQNFQLIHKLETIWASSILWTTPTSASLDSMHTHLKTQLKLTTVASSGMATAMDAMEALNILDKRLKLFGKKLIQFMFRPLTVFPSLKPCVEIKKQDIVISLVRDSTRVKIIEPGKVYSKISEVLEVFKTYFHPVKEDKPCKNNGDENAVQIFPRLGKFLWPVLSEDLINDCLAKSIPNTSAQLEKYLEVISDTEQFEGKLQALGFLKESPSSLIKYVKDVSVHFGNKKCQDLLVTARDLMKDDIHNTVLVDRNSDTGFLASLGAIKDPLKANQRKEPVQPAKSENDLSQFTFHLPTCRISESTKKLMDLAFNTLIEATTSPQESAVQLFYTVRNMFELFCNVVPTYHQESLRRQRAQLLDIIKATGGFADANEDDRGIKIERAIKQVLHQLTHLKKMWQGVLPVDLFQQSVGTLLDVVLLEITDEVLKLEDISSDEAHWLNSLLTIVTDKAPEIFQESSKEKTGVEPFTVVPHWTRYKQLISILEASLQDVTDAWTDGKGPLAQDFTAAEVRGLIRALFQNTDRRATVLAKIKAV